MFASFVHDLGATVASLNQQTADRIAVNASHALGGADGIAFEQGCDYGEFLSDESVYILACLSGEASR